MRVLRYEEDVCRGPTALGEINVVCVIFTGFGGPRWPIALELILFFLEEESGDLLGPTTSLETSGLNLLGGWRGWQPPGA